MRRGVRGCADVLSHEIYIHRGQVSTCRRQLVRPKWASRRFECDLRSDSGASVVGASLSTDEVSRIAMDSGSRTGEGVIRATWGRGRGASKAPGGRARAEAVKEPGSEGEVDPPAESGDEGEDIRASMREADLDALALVAAAQVPAIPPVVASVSLRLGEFMSHDLAGSATGLRCANGVWQNVGA